MAAGMHADEIRIGPLQAIGLLASQFPELAHLPIVPLDAAGTDNMIYRLGADLAIRFPRTAAAALQVEKESKWLPLLAPHLPLALPLPRHIGKPGSDNPYPWSICGWIEGDNAYLTPPSDLTAAARGIAGFLWSMRTLPVTDGPAPGGHNFGRGVPLAERDTVTRRAIESLTSLIDTGLAHRVWADGLSAPVHDAPPVWIHGDIHPANLIVREGRLAGIIDFGGLAMGDPACDLMIAWSMLSLESRTALRKALSIDDAAWRRGRAWALSVAVIALPYYLNSNQFLVSLSRRTIAEVIADLTG